MSDEEIAGKRLTMYPDTYDPEVIRRALRERRYVVVVDDGVYVPPPVEPEVDRSTEA